MSPLTAPTCPLCQGRLLRRSRTWFDHWIDGLVHVRRYRCAAAACGWQGLRRHCEAPASDVARAPDTAPAVPTPRPDAARDRVPAHPPGEA